MSPLRRIIAWQWKYARGALLLGILVAITPALAGIALLGVAGWFITAAALAGIAGAFLNVFLPSALIRGLAILRTAGRYGERLLTHDATFRFLTNLRSRIFQGQSALTGDGAQPARSGAALNRLTSDVAALDTVYLRLIVPAVIAAVVSITALIWMARLAPSAAIALAGFVIWSLANAYFLIRRCDTKRARRQEAAQEAVRLRSVDLVAGRRDLAVYGGLEATAASVLAAGDRLAAVDEELDQRSTRLSALSGFAGQVFLAVVLFLSCLLMLEGSLAPAWGVALVLVAIALPDVFGALVPGLASFPRTMLAAARAVRGVGMSPSQHDRTPVSASTNAVLTPLLVFNQVSFSYPGAASQVLNAFSFQVNPGEIVALTGRSGCGKSTVSALAARLLSPHGGTIRLLGRELNAYDESELRRTVTVLGQRPYLFNDTVAANLRIADTTADDDALWAALEMAALGDRIRNSERGLETVLGEGGLGLSGGEQRRLGLARAYLTRPALFILDEMTEGLDVDTAEDVLRRFETFRGEAGVLMIAHKTQEIDRADRILGLRDAEEGLAAE